MVNDFLDNLGAQQYEKLIKTNVISLGSWGWSTDQQLIQFKRKKKIISKPQLVLR